MKIIGFIWLALGLSLTCTAQSEVLQQYLDIQHKRMHFNGIVLVTKDGQPLYQVNMGAASQELNVPLNSRSVFTIASISKQFTAMLTVLAVREGRFRLQDSLAAFFSQITDTQWRKINVHQLLSHTSGVPHNEGIKDYWQTKSRLSLSKEQALTEIFGMKLLFTPGSSMQYSSPGYFLLACILESVYHRPYAALLKEKILQPLQMSHTGVYVTGEIVPGMVEGYHLFNDSLAAVPYRDFSLMKGSGDLYSSASDLGKWNNSFSDATVWSDSLQKQLFTPQNKNARSYGYGWYLRQGERPVYYHGGGTFGCSALSAWYPGEKVAIVILSNVSVLPVNELWNDIEKIVFKEPFTLPVINQVIQLSPGRLGGFTGTYRHDQQELRIVLLNGQLYAKMGTNPPFEIYPEADLKFFGKKVNIQLTFKTGAEGNITGFDAAVKGQIFHFNKQ